MNLWIRPTSRAWAINVVCCVSVSLNPGGHGDSAEGMANLYLWNKSDKAIDIDFGFSVIDVNGQWETGSVAPSNKIISCTGGGVRWKDFKKHSNLLSSLVNGALVIEVGGKRERGGDRKADQDLESGLVILMSKRERIISFVH